MNPRMNRCISAILLCFCMISFCFAQQKPYRITIKWNSEGSSYDGKMSYLTGFHGDEVQVYDSVVVRKGTSVFKGKSLPDGFYQVKADYPSHDYSNLGALPQGRRAPIDLVISESRKFTYWTDAAGHFEGSPENEAYQLAHFQINTYDSRWPDITTLETASVGHDLVYKYLLLEYLGLDACTTPDARMLHHPLFNQLISDKLQSENITIIDSVFDRYSLETEIGQYYMVQTLKYYNMDNNVAYDDILLHLYDKYYLPSGLQLFSESYERRLKNGVTRKRHLAIGAQMPPLEAKSADGKLISTASIDRPNTVIWFWDADCEDCLEETPILNEMYEKYQEEYDFEVFGYCITADVKRWKQVSEEMGLKFINTCDGLGGSNYDVIDFFNILTTPACLLLDQDHKIIMRQFTLEQLEEFFNNLNPDKYNIE